MRGLFLKIFICFWIAQSLIFVLSIAMIVRHRFERPEDLFHGFATALGDVGQSAIQAYQSGGCPALESYAASLGQSVNLADSSKGLVCENKDNAAFQNFLSRADFSRNPTSLASSTEHIWGVPVNAKQGQRYYFLLRLPRRAANPPWYHDLRHFAFPQLPIAIVVCGATTFVLVLLLTRPIAKIRSAARELALGHLQARVELPSRQTRILEGDEIQALMVDFNHMASRLESLVAAQKLLLRDVSHELRSPLARLSVALELANDEASPSMLLHLQRMERETARLNSLVGQLLTLSSMESMERTRSAVEFSLNNLIDEMLPDAEYEAEQRKCGIQFLSSSECRMEGNSELIYRAVENVLRNAIRYTEEGSVIEITLKQAQDTNQPMAILEISDRGPGIPEEQLTAIFRPFFRVDSSRQRETGGFGVGLAIADRAVKLHHGELKALNRPDGGTTMQMRLPCVSVKANASQLQGA